MHDDRALRRDRAAHALAVAIYGVIALELLAPALGPQRVPGVELGESWGRMFVTGQVLRWVTGAAPVGVADLAGWPARVPFWPIDPVVQAVSLPLVPLVGLPGALTGVTLLLVWLAGYGPWRLARELGATRTGALLAGLTVQLCPFLLLNVADLVLEVEAVGIMAIAAEACVRAVRSPSARRALTAGGWVAALAAASPYLAVYLAMGCALAVLPTWRRWRGWLLLAGAAGIGCALALAPLAWAEGGPHGRLAITHGYHLDRPPLVDADGNRVEPNGRPVRLDHPLDKPASKEPIRRPSAPLISSQQRWRRALNRVPGGLALVLATGIALVLPGARWWGLLAAAFFLGGPGVPLALRAAGWHAPTPSGPFTWLLEHLPLTSKMGNPTRMLAAFALAAGTAGGLAVRGARVRRLVTTGVLLGATAATVYLSVPALHLPATSAEVDRVALAALHGPTIIFPSGDPPVWNPRVRPKEALYLAARAGVPVAYDYGRGRWPADAPAQRELARIARTPVGEPLVRHPEATTWPPEGFRSLLVLDDRLDRWQRDRLHRWLAAHARLQAQGERWSAWALDGG